MSDDTWRDWPVMKAAREAAERSRHVGPADLSIQPIVEGMIDGERIDGAVCCCFVARSGGATAVACGPPEKKVETVEKAVAALDELLATRHA